MGKQFLQHFDRLGKTYKPQQQTQPGYVIFMSTVLHYEQVMLTDITHFVDMPSSPLLRFTLSVKQHVMPKLCIINRQAQLFPYPSQRKKIFIG